MRKLLVCTIFLLVLPIIGCDIHSSDKLKIIQTRMDAVEDRITSLESRADVVEQQQSAIEELLNKTYTKIATNNLSTMDIQIALKNAGFYNGHIDGKIGPGTTNAIKEFQKSNGLKADGIVGVKTRDLLVKHLSEATD